MPYPNPLWSLFCLHGSTWICASNIAGRGPSWPVATGAYSRAREQMSPYPRRRLAAKNPLWETAKVVPAYHSVAIGLYESGSDLSLSFFPIGLHSSKIRWPFHSAYVYLSQHCVTLGWFVVISGRAHYFTAWLIPWKSRLHLNLAIGLSGSPV